MHRPCDFKLLLASLLVLCVRASAGEYEGGITVRPRVGMAGDGSFVIVWSDLAEVRAQRYDTDGEEVGEEIVVTDKPGRIPDDVHDHSVGMNGSGCWSMRFWLRGSWRVGLFGGCFGGFFFVGMWCCGSDGLCSRVIG